MDYKYQTSTSGISLHNSTSGQSSDRRHPSYPSPAHRVTESFNFTPEGLGLYPFRVSITDARSFNAPDIYPLDPQVSNGWTPAVDANTSSQVLNSWNNFETPHPTPMAWHDPFPVAPMDHVQHRLSISPSSRELSHSSSISSTYESSIYSGDGVETMVAPAIKQEYMNEWCQEVQQSDQILTVAPSHLIATSATYLSTDGLHSPAWPGTESFSDSEGHYGDYQPEQNTKDSISTSQGTEQRKKRSRTGRDNAGYECDLCHDKFSRAYNLKQHMDSDKHNPSFPKLHRCEDCDRRFKRKLDLVRHIESVHKMTKNYSCSMCSNSFARKDTLRRHEESGCPKRPQFRRHSPAMRGRRRSRTHSSSPSLLFQHSERRLSTQPDQKFLLSSIAGPIYEASI